jgi:putative addiction module antidote
MSWSGWAKKLKWREFARITFVERMKLSCYTFRITGGQAMNEMPRKLSEGEFLQIRKIGNSVGVILPKELLARLNLKEGDKFYPVEQPDGSLRLSPFNPKHARTMEIAREIMHEYRDTFAALAK